MRDGMKKVKQHKGYVIASGNDGLFHIFTMDEWAYGAGLRSEEHEAGSVKEALDWIG